jgi:hypothetical protein
VNRFCIGSHRAGRASREWRISYVRVEKYRTDSLGNNIYIWDVYESSQILFDSPHSKTEAVSGFSYQGLEQNFELGKFYLLVRSWPADLDLVRSWPAKFRHRNALGVLAQMYGRRPNASVWLGMQIQDGLPPVHWRKQLLCRIWSLTEAW